MISKKKSDPYITITIEIIVTSLSLIIKQSLAYSLCTPHLRYLHLYIKFKGDAAADLLSDCEVMLTAACMYSQVYKLYTRCRRGLGVLYYYVYTYTYPRHAISIGVIYTYIHPTGTLPPLSPAPLPPPDSLKLTFFPSAQSTHTASRVSHATPREDVS